MNGNIRVGNLFGIPFYVNPSWFFILGLVTLSYGAQLATGLHLQGILPWLLGLLAALLLFASVLAHELGHSLVALAQGIEVKSITLFIFGGLATLEKESETPLQSFLVAIAGPVVSLVLFTGLLLIQLNFALPIALDTIISLLASINLILALFNLIPGLPLDGGNILKAAIWQITGNPNKGVLFASRVGQFFGYLAILIGILSVLGISQIGSFWTILIGFFLLQNAGISAQSARVQETLSNFSAADAVMLNSPVISADLTLRDFANDYVIGKNQWKKFLIINAEQELLGTIYVDDLRKVATSLWTEVKVTEIMQPKDNVQTVAANLSLLEVVKLLENLEEKQLTVIKENGTVLGLLEKDSIIDLLQRKALNQMA